MQRIISHPVNPRRGSGEKAQDTLTNLQLPTTVDINLRDIYEKVRFSLIQENHIQSVMQKILAIFNYPPSSHTLT